MEKSLIWSVMLTTSIRTRRSKNLSKQEKWNQSVFRTSTSSSSSVLWTIVRSSPSWTRLRSILIWPTMHWSIFARRTTSRYDYMKMFISRIWLKVMAYSPLGNPSKPVTRVWDENAKTILQDEKLLAMAKKYNKTVAQICIRFGIQRGLILIPKVTFFIIRYFFFFRQRIQRACKKTPRSLTSRSSLARWTRSPRWIRTSELSSCLRTLVSDITLLLTTTLNKSDFDSPQIWSHFKASSSKNWLTTKVLQRLPRSSIKPPL
jgi:hypothetical protein